MTKATHLLRSRLGTVLILCATGLTIALVTLVGVRTSTPTKHLTGLRSTATGLNCAPEQDPSPTHKGYGVPTGFSMDHVVMTDGPMTVTKAEAQGCGNLQFPFSLSNQGDPFWAPDPTKPFAGAGVPANQIAFTPGAVALAGLPMIGAQANIAAAPGSATYAVLHQQTDPNVPGAIHLDMWTTLVGTLTFSVGGQTLMTCNIDPITLNMSTTLPGGQPLEGPLNDVVGSVAAIPFKIHLSSCPTAANQIPLLGGLIDPTIAALLANALQQMANGYAQMTAHLNMSLNLGNPAAIVQPSG